MGAYLNAYAASFVIEDIEIKGIKKIAVGTVLNYLPLKAGETFDYQQSADVIRELYKTGFFDAVSLYRVNNTLMIEVDERPAIAEVNQITSKPQSVQAPYSSWWLSPRRFSGPCSSWGVQWPARG